MMERNNRYIYRIASQLWVGLILFALLAGFNLVQAAATYVQKNGSNTHHSAFPVGNIQVDVSANQPVVGNTIIVTFASDYSSPVSPSCTDNMSNTYTVDMDYLNGNTLLIVCSAQIATGKVPSTITVNHRNAYDRTVTVHEFSGLLTASAKDKSASAGGTSTAPSSGTTATTVQADELVLGAVAVAGPDTDGFTADGNFPGGPDRLGLNTNNQRTINMQYRTVSSTGTYSYAPTLGTSRQWAAAVITYKAEAGDAIAPDAVADLATNAPTSTSIGLTWTAPGDDGSTGTATSYDIRYSTSTITEGNWASATQVAGEPSPSVAASSESMTVTGLSGGTTYYFAIKTDDEVPNTSSISNIPSATTTTDSTAPSAVSDLSIGTISSTSIGLTWTAPGDDGSSGTATTYDVRYSTSTITEGNWGSATQATGEPSPSVAGTLESFIVTGLSTSTTYYFAIKTSDEVPNTSALSNIPTDATVSATTLTLHPSGANASNSATMTTPATDLDTNDGATTYGNSAGSANDFYLDIDDTAQTGTIDSVIVKAVAADGGGWSSDPTFRIGVKTNGSEYFDASQTQAATTYATHTGDTYTTNPQTGVAWTWTEINALIGIVDHNNSSNPLRVTELYVLVDYTPDTVGPSATSNLATNAPTSNSISLTWTAPGDDGFMGTATSYDIRYSTSVINEGNWASATQATGEPTPSAGGSGESFTVTGLSAGTTYYFAMKTTDDATNTSSLSNVPSAATSATDSTAPASVTLSAGSPSENSVQLTWTSPGDDTNSGTATSYDIRYSTSAITAGNWASASTVSGEPIPQIAGSSEYFTVTGLTASTLYYFAIKTSDEVPNTSTISNSSSATTSAGSGGSVSLHPSGANASDNASYTSSAATNLDTNDGDTTRGTANGSGNDLYLDIDDTALTGTIDNVQVKVVAAEGSGFSSAPQFDIGLKTNGSTYFDGGHTQSSTSYSTFSGTTYSTNPQTTSAWTWAEINALVGIVDRTNSGNPIDVTELYVVVNYTPGDSTAPAASTLSIDTITSSSIKLDWTAPGDDASTGTASAYDIRYSTSSINAANWAFATQVTGEPAPSVASTAETFTITGLSAETTYYFAMKTRDEVPNISTLSNVVNGTTLDGTVPGDITDLATGTVTSQSVDLSWTAPGDDGATGTATTYNIRYSTSVLNAGNWASATQATGEPSPSVAGTSESFSVTGLSGSTTYYFAIKTSDEAANESGVSNSPSGATVADIFAPSDVSDLATSNATNTTIDLAWTAPGDDAAAGTATTYDIRYSTSTINTGNWGAATQINGEPTPSVASTSESMTVTGLSAGTTYYFAIKTGDEIINWSGVSNSPSLATTGGDETAPAAVSDLSGGSATTSSILLSWTAPGDDGSTGTATTYDIRYSTSTITEGNWGSATTITGEPSPSVAGSAESKTVSGLTAGTVYYFAIKIDDEIPNTSALSNNAVSSTVANGTTLTLHPSGANASDNASYTSSAATNLDTNDGDTTRGTASGSSNDFYLDIDDTAQTGTVNSVQVKAVASEGTGWSSAPQFTIGLKTNGSNYFDGGHTQSSTSYSTFSGTTYNTNPQTTSAWTWTEINALVGIVNRTNSGNPLDVTELYVEIAYVPADTTAPSSVTLSTGTITNTSIALSWTAPGDDGANGTASAYDIRYSTSAITAGNWASATQVTGEPSPGVATTSESFTVTGLSPNTAYYFAIKTGDEAPNWSTISNSPTATTTVAPVGGYTADNVIPTAQVTQATDASGIMTINWKGRDDEADNVTLNTFQYSVDGGTTWQAPGNDDASASLSTNWSDNGSSWSTATTLGVATAHSFTFNTQHGTVSGLAGVDQSDVQLRFKLNDGSSDSGWLTSQSFQVDNAIPTSTITSSAYNAASDTLTITGTNFTTIAAASTDIKSYVDWAKFVWDINGDNATTANITFVVGDVTSLTVTDATTLTLVFTGAKGTAIEGTTGYGGAGGADTLDVTAGFSKDVVGNTATTDAVADGTLTVGSAVITVMKLSAVISDPVNSTTNPKRIPGAVIEYTVVPSNSGTASPDANTVVVTDVIDADSVSFDTDTGVTFADGTTASALMLGAVTYSSTAAPGPYLYDYTPSAGYDGAVTSIKITTTGTFNYGGAPDPSFTLRYRVLIK